MPKNWWGTVGVDPGSFAKYVAAIANSIADSASSAGSPSSFQWNYTGPAINPDPNAATLVDTATKALEERANSDDLVELAVVLLELDELILEGHLETCVADSFREGRSKATVGELLDIFKTARG